MYFIHLFLYCVYNWFMDFLEHLKNSIPEEDAIKLYESLDLEDEHAVLLTFVAGYSSSP